MNKEEVLIRLEDKKPLRIGNKDFKSVCDWTLSEKDLEKAARELGETDSKIKECLRKLKEKLSNEPNVNYRLHDFYLLRFLRVRKFNVKKAHQNMQLFMQMKRKHLHLISIPPLQELKPVQQLNWITALPYINEEGNNLLLLNLNKWDPGKRTYEELASSAINVLDLVSMNPKCQINGIIAIYDLKGVSLRHIKELLSNDRLWNAVTGVQNAYPWRIKGFYVLHTNSLVRFAYSIIKPFLQKKIKDRCVLLGSDVNELHKYVNPALLPKTLNGMLEDDECDFSKHVFDNLEYLKYERSFM